MFHYQPLPAGEMSNHFFPQRYSACGWFLARGDFPFMECSGQRSVSTQGVFNAPSRAASPRRLPERQLPPVCAHDVLSVCEAQHIKFSHRTPPAENVLSYFAPHASGQNAIYSTGGSFNPRARHHLCAAGLISGRTSLQRRKIQWKWRRV